MLADEIGNPSIGAGMIVAVNPGAFVHRGYDDAIARKYSPQRNGLKEKRKPNACIMHGDHLLKR